MRRSRPKPISEQSQRSLNDWPTLSEPSASRTRGGVKLPLLGLIVLSLFAGACSSSATGSRVTAPTSTPATSGPSGTEPERTPVADDFVPVAGDVVPVAGEPCSYLAREEVEAFAGQPIQFLTVTGESCIWSFAPLTAGSFIGERPTLRLSVLTGSDEFEALRPDADSEAATDISDLGDDAFVRAGDGVNGGETYLLEGSTTIVVVFQLVFAQFTDQVSTQHRVAELVLSRL
jgi:hypothetical protein